MKTIRKLDEFFKSVLYRTLSGSICLERILQKSGRFLIRSRIHCSDAIQTSDPLSWKGTAEPFHVGPFIARPGHYRVGPPFMCRGAEDPWKCPTQFGLHPESLTDRR